MANTATAARPRYSESVHVLVDRPTRAVLLGIAIERAAKAGAERPKEGEVVRDLIAMALEEIERTMSKRTFSEVKAAGEAALADRDAKLAASTPLAPLPADAATA